SHGARCSGSAGWLDGRPGGLVTAWLPMLRARAHADVFRAIADPTRRALLDRLRAGGRPVGELAADFRTSRPAISKHLRVLRQARLVREHREGRRRRHELTPAPPAHAY